jgi:Flp pilus assembly protein TadD
MIFRGIFATTVISIVTCFTVTTESWAADGDNESDKIKQILMNTKLSELEMNVDQSSGSKTRDTSSVQYKIGFKDGYQKAVADLKNSLNDKTLIPASGDKKDSQVADKEEQAAAALLTKSFQDLVNEGNWGAAISAASKAIKLNPNDPVAYINRSWGFAETGKFKAALSDANKAVQLSPRNAMAHNNRAYAYELSGSLTNAKKDYKIACELNYQPACDTVAKFDRALTGDTVAEVKELLNRSYEKFKDKDWGAVEEMSTRAISLDPSNAMAYVNRAGARAELGLLSTALDDCNRAIQLNPGLGLAHNNCGYTYELMGRAKQAELEYQQACNLGIKQSCKDYHRISK